MRNPIYWLLSTLVVAIFATVVSAQTPAKPAQSDDRVVVGTNLVTVNVIVTDRSGRYVKGLTRNQFQLYDENTKQNIAHFSADASPVSLGIVLEVHETTAEKTRAMLAAVKEFTRTLNSSDDFFFVAFSKHGSVTTEFIPSLEQVINHLTFVKPGGPSALYDALYLATERLQKTRNLKKALLVISDGQDEQSRHSYKELRNRLRTFDAQVYAIGIADPATDPFAGYGRWVFEDITRQTGRRSFLMNSESAMGRGVLAEMSRVSGGTAYIPESESEPELTGICSQIARELREQYTLGFYPSDLTSSKWHRLRVRVSSPKRSSGLSLSYRKGYQLAFAKDK